MKLKPFLIAACIVALGVFAWSFVTKPAKLSEPLTPISASVTRAEPEVELLPIPNDSDIEAAQAKRCGSFFASVQSGMPEIICLPNIGTSKQAPRAGVKVAYPKNILEIQIDDSKTIPTLQNITSGNVNQGNFRVHKAIIRISSKQYAQEANCLPQSVN